MAMASVILTPGVNVELTPSLNQAGISQSQLIRFKDQLIQTYGGWDSFFGTTIGSTIRDLHAWQGISNTKYLGIGATQSLTVYNSDLAGIQPITPQTRTTNPAPNFSISSGSFAVTIVDANSGPTIFNTVFFNTPVAIGNLLLNGGYDIVSVLSTGSYIINSSVAASTTIVSSGVLPIFTTSSGSATVTVDLPNNNFPQILGEEQTFYAPTAAGGLTIQGPYDISSITNSTEFTITATTQASSAAIRTMNGGLAQLVYYVSLGPPATGSGFGSGGFGSGGFGTGTPAVGTPGTPITALDWTQDNWGSILLACPENGAIYTWSANSGLQNAQVISQAPFFNGGIYISQPQQILVAWRSTQNSGTQDHLKIRWSDALDFTNWTVSNQTSAGSFELPTGSIIVGGLQAQNFAVLSTDVDVWIQQYVGGDVIFNHTRIGAGCGWIGKHAAGVLGGAVMWCGQANFFSLVSGGVSPMPCTVWDFIFQNINTGLDANGVVCSSKVRAAPNSVFNEMMWEFPYGTSTENNAYVKAVMKDGQPVWDYGFMDRTAWIDISVFGNPIGADSGAFLYQHEEGTMNVGAANPSFQTGWWSITEGNDLAYIDWLMPDFRWGTFGGAQNAGVSLTFFSVDFPGDVPRQYGPYTVTQATEYINPRIRGRLMMLSGASQTASFWRLGRIRYKWSPMGRR